MQNSPSSTLLKDKAQLLAERLIGLCDRNIESPSRGCFDRHYWCYKLHDIANARYQEASLYLAITLKSMHPNHKAAIENLIHDSLTFWSSIRNTDGSVNEIYPYERSFCATSMSTATITGAWLRLNNAPDIDFTLTGDWLLKNNNAEVTNQMAGACLALERIAKITGIDRYHHAAADKLTQIQEHLLCNGCFGEYGGPDIGYATITLSLLAGYHQLTESSECLEAMNICEKYLDDQIDEDGLFDWKSTSRRTQFIYPFGIAYLNSSIIRRVLSGLQKNLIINPLWMDDRYSIPLALDYMLAAEHIEKSGLK